MEKIPIFMDNEMYDKISRSVRKSYPNACILFIDEVKNSILEEKYNELKKKILDKRGDVKEELLFHGTHADLIDIIAFEGFDPEKNCSSSYGRGTYFAKDASYSFTYMKSPDSRGISYMFLSKVIIGECGYSGETKELDNYVNNVINPTIYVTPHRYGAYPAYIIAFNKNAI